MFSLATRLHVVYSVMSIQTCRGVLYLQNVITVSRCEHVYKPHFVCERKEGTAVRVPIFVKLGNVKEHYLPLLLNASKFRQMWKIRYHFIYSRKLGFYCAAFDDTCGHLVHFVQSRKIH
jgi:hypothetical protein